MSDQVWILAWLFGAAFWWTAVELARAPVLEADECTGPGVPDDNVNAVIPADLARTDDAPNPGARPAKANAQIVAESRAPAASLSQQKRGVLTPGVENDFLKPVVSRRSLARH